MQLYHLLAGLMVVIRAQSRCLTDTPEVNPKRYFYSDGQMLDLRLEVSGRVTHRLATAVFKLFLQEVLGYSSVTIVEEDDHFNITHIVQRLSGPLTSLTVPSSMVNLEVWIAPDTNLIEFTNAYQVKDCGAVAPAGRFGWFVPLPLAYLVPGMDHWRIFADESTASLFSMSDRDFNYVQSFARLSATDKFYCEESFCTTGIFTPTHCNTSCAVLLAGHPGPACSDTVEPLAGVTKHFRTVVISYSAEGSTFSDRSKYPYFFRTIGENTQYKFVYLQLFQKLGWEQVAALTEDGHKYTEYISHTQDLLQANGITFVVNRKFPRDREKASMSKYLQELKNKKVHIIIGDMFDVAVRDVMCQAYNLKMTAQEGYVWFLPQWLAPNWYDTDYYNAHHLENVMCSTTQMIDAINGHLSLAHAYFASDSELMQENITVRQWRQKYKSVCRARNVSESNYAGFTYDAVWTYALALNNLVKENQSLLADIHSSVSTQRFVEMLEATDFHGVSGRIKFRGASRVSDINVLQWLNNRTQVVGSFHPNFSVLHQELSGGRYDKKVQQTQNYMMSLGIDLLAAQNMSSLDKWEISRDRVVINRKLGEGAFGMVYGGEALFEDKGWVAVAVKTLKVGSTMEEKLDFLSEAEVMKRFEHKNIVKLLGVCTKNEPVYTIMEFMLYGDLKTFLLARRHLVNERISEESEEISSKKLTMMAMDVARALSYLAELKYVHRDVASRNCLVNASRIVKLGDFGLTRPMYESDYYKFNRKGMLPVRWMAPESLELGVFSPSSDVWSYGVLLYEIITFGSFPFQGMSNSQVLEHVKNGNTLPIPAGVKPQLEGLIRSCWNFDHKRRPQVSEIVEFVANNPRLISPCLDVPLASVQMDDYAEQLEMGLPNITFRKCSVPMKFMSQTDAAACAYVREPLLLSTHSLSSTEFGKYMELNSEVEPGGMQPVSIL
ncbi:hypothetical protein B7P43_G15826 [Cryptotermes secundus]|uniref:Gamma-aminobutyric acid type B receptor subunit 2 n=1 Tax=Cryptotermes secundus TaxID=105785 RepID=A0A2J7Q6M3_9NEOP|nr:hypothetical protein B7P43_G15826 [Cryptotermes secundus]